MLVYSKEDLTPIGYKKSTFQLDQDFRKSTCGTMFTLGRGAIIWRSIKQSCIVDSTIEAEYMATWEATKKVVWLKISLIDLQVVFVTSHSMTLYSDNSEAVSNSKKPRSHKGVKCIERKNHLI